MLLPAARATTPQADESLAPRSGAVWYRAGTLAAVAVLLAALWYFTVPGELHLCTPRHYNGRVCTADLASVTRADLAGGLVLVVAAPGHRDFVGDGARVTLLRSDAAGVEHLVGWRDVPLDIASNVEQYDLTAIVKRMAIPDPRAGVQFRDGDHYVLRVTYNAPISGSPEEIGTMRFTYSVRP